MKSILPLISNVVFALLFLGALFQAQEARRNCDEAISIAKEWQTLEGRCAETRDEAIKDLQKCVMR
jgi:hypothetical protein